MIQVYIYTSIVSPRLHYVTDFIKNQFDELDLTITNSIDSISHSNAIIQYGNTKVNDSFWIQNLGLNQLENLEKAGLSYVNELPILFETKDDLGFDLFSGIFWLLTFQSELRVPENQKDQHGRISVKQHIFYKNNNYKIPVIDYWIDIFISKVNQQFNLKIQRKKSYTFSIGIDIDQAWKYKYKPFYKTYGGLLKSVLSLDLKEFKNRYSVIFGNAKDPFDTYDYLGQLGLSDAQLMYFILNGNHSLDPNHPLTHPKYIELLKELSQNHSIGIHPSYLSSQQEELFSQEKNELEKILSKPITKSRQHYLRINIPNTFIELSKIGIQEDYSIAFYDETGFRTGTSHPFYFYNIKEEQVTPLQIYPVIAMDRTYQQYLQSSQEEIISDYKSLIQKAKKFQGHAHVIWHNSSFDFDNEWKGLESVIEKIITLMMNSRNRDKS